MLNEAQHETERGNKYNNVNTKIRLLYFFPMADVIVYINESIIMYEYTYYVFYK